MTRKFDGFFDLRLKQQLSEQQRRRWFETPSRSLWRHFDTTAQCKNIFPYITHKCERVAPFGIDQIRNGDDWCRDHT